MKMLKHCLSYLQRNGVRYSHSVHPAAFTAEETASAERMPARALVKTVVYSGDNGYGMLLLSADHVADFDEVRRLLGLTEIRLATEPSSPRYSPIAKSEPCRLSETCSTCRS
jgi:Ala-tRNA(Pro) deacylase